MFLSFFVHLQTQERNVLRKAQFAREADPSVRCESLLLLSEFGKTRAVAGLRFAHSLRFDDDGCIPFASFDEVLDTERQLSNTAYLLVCLRIGTIQQQVSSRLLELG